MEINKKTRIEIKRFFQINDKPTQAEFADFIDANLNQVDDGIAKVQGNPLSIEAEGDKLGSQGILDLFTRFADENPQWSINLNPRIDSDEPNSNQPGFNIKDATGQSRFFIKSGTGNVGIGTIEPSAPLAIKGAGSGKSNNSMQLAEDSIIFGSESANGNTDSAKIEVDQNTLKIYGKTSNSNASIRKLDVIADGGMTVKGALNVDGNITVKNLKADNISTSTDLDQDGASNEKVPTQRAVKEYVDNRLPQGLISMWSGQTIPNGWALCDGNNNTPDLSGRFIVGLDNGNNDYKNIGQTGGLENVQLTEAQLPAHKHEDKGHIHGVHDLGHNHTNGDFDRLVRYTGNDTHKGTDNDDGAGGEFDISNSKEIKHKKTGISIIEDHADIQNTGGNQAHENRPPYFVLAYIMKR